MSTDQHPLNSPLRGSAFVRANMPHRVRRVLEQLFALVCDQYANDLEKLLDVLERQLLQISQEPAAALMANPMDAVDRLRQHRADLVPQFLVGLEAALAQIREPAPDLDAPASMPPNQFSNLRLVDEHEIDEDASLRMIAVRHESRGSLPLLLLGQRFGVLAGAPAFEAERLPIGPNGLCRVLSASARALQINLQSRMLLYRLFDRHLGATYMSLVEAMNLLLVRENVLPGLSYVPLRTRRATGPRPAGEAPAGSAETGSSQRSVKDTERDATPGRSSTTPYTGWPGVAERETGDAEDSGMFEVLQEMLTQRRGLVEKLRARSSNPVPEALSNLEVIEALAGMQSSSTAGRKQGNVSDIRQTLLAQSRQQRGGAAALSREDSDTFELLGLMYAAIGRELREDAPSKPLLDRLQLPLLRLALQDRAFFIRSQHPARQLLNSVAESGAKWSPPDEADPQLQQQLNNVVEHVVEHYQGDAAVFETANQSLQQHLHKTARRSEVSERRHVEAARGKEKLELARRRALDIIEAAMLGQDMPRFLQTVLLQAWADVLTLVLLRHGQQSPQWRQHGVATRQIVAASRQAGPPADALIQLIQDGLGLVGYQSEEAAAIARRLTSTEEAADTAEDPVSRTELAMMLKARTRLGPETQQSPAKLAPRTPLEQACYQQLRSVPFGTWIEFVTNQQGDVVRRRMAWFSVVTDRVLFVNQRGMRVDDQSLDHLARLIASDQARIVTADTARLVDRAWLATLGTLRQLSTRKELPAGNAHD